MTFLQWRPRNLPVLALSRSCSTHRTIMTRNYADAVRCLNSLQSNHTIVDAIRRSGRALNTNAIPEMTEWCRKIGYEPSDFDRLSCIHIAGTKGKGSTAAFVSSVLCQYIGVGQPRAVNSRRLSKIGLYTSPHLRFVRERIQINNKPLTEDKFAQYFFEIWDRLENTAIGLGLDPTNPSTKPVYFRFLTLMAFHTYISEGVDAAIIECGIGGEYDSTNILIRPTVTGITSLGIDHVGVLGKSIEEIAWHKAGIMKQGVKCFTCASQALGALQVLKERSIEKGVELVAIDLDNGIKSEEIPLGLQADFQKINASLAVALAGEWLKSKGFEINNGSVNDAFKKGLAEVKLGGRCETRREASIIWCIDGGHTLESVELAGKWFAKQVTATSKSAKSIRILIFNQQTRDAGALARALHLALVTALQDKRPFAHVIFCTNTTFEKTGFRADLVSLNASSADVEEMRVQKDLAKTWKEIDPSTESTVVITVEAAVECVRRIARTSGRDEEVLALVTGSLHLVGGFLEVIETKPG